MPRTITVVLALAWTMAATVAHAAMQKGDVVPVAAETSLKTRPTPDAEALAPAPAGASATLSVRISNTSGDWWYVEIDGQKGWLPESALAGAAPSGAPEAAPPPQVSAAPAAVAAAPPVAVAAPVVAPAAVQEARDMRKAKTAEGSREIGVGFDFSREEDSDGYELETLSLDLSYGYCLSDVDEVGLQIGYVKVAVEDDSIDSYLVGPFYIHNFRSASEDTAPFVGVLFAITESDLGVVTIDGQVMEITAGLRYFAGADFAVNFGAYYRKSDLDVEGFSLDSTTTGLRVTLSGFLR